MPTITTEIDLYSAVLPKGENSVTVPYGQRVRIKNNSIWGATDIVTGIGVHILEDYPSEMDVLSLAKAVPIATTDVGDGEYDHVAVVRADWIGVRYVTFVYQVPAGTINDPNAVDLEYYPVRVQGIEGDTDVTNVVIKQLGLATTLICEEKGDVVVCADVPVDKEVIFVLKNTTTQELKEINAFADDLLPISNGDFSIAEVTVQRCLTIPIEALMAGYDYELLVIANDGGTTLNCTGCLEATFVSTIKEVGGQRIRRELSVNVSGGGTGTVRDANGSHAINTPYDHVSDQTTLFLIAVFKDDLGCVYRREFTLYLATARPSSRFDIYQDGFDLKAKDLTIVGLAPNESYVFHYSFNGTAGTINLGSDQYGIASQLGTWANIGNGPVMMTSHLVFNGMTCPSLEISPNNPDPIEPMRINIEYDSSDCLEGYQQVVDLCVDPGSAAGGDPPNVPVNNLCYGATGMYITSIGVGTANGTLIGATLDTSVTTSYSVTVGHDMDVWLKLTNLTGASITKDLVVEGITTNPLSDFAMHTHIDNAGCGATMVQAAQGITSGNTLTIPNVMVGATSFVMVRITVATANAGAYRVTYG